MAEIATPARPYARAAFESASASSQLPAWSEFLARAAAVVHDPRVAGLIGNPRVAHEQLVELIAGLAAPGAPQSAPASPQHSFLQLLSHNRRLPLLPEIAAQFEVLRAQAEHVADVELISARELSPQQSQMLRTALERRLGRSVRLHERVDADLIGGAIVRHGDFVLDGSVRGRIERLGAAMSGV
jgi:F-type H+-transporting ATPase subunit delta